MQFHFVYITCAHPEEAQRIGTLLVEGRFAACANILPGMQSIYRWNGDLTKDQETVLIVKTSSDKLPSLIEESKRLHSYEVPCIVALPIVDGNPAYLEWLQQSLNGE